MEYKYFILDKNPLQIKKLSLGEHDVTLRIEWNIRSKCWYILGYIGDDLVMRNTKMSPYSFYTFDEDSGYSLPFVISVYPEFEDYDWDTVTMVIVADDVFSRDGLSIDRMLTTSSMTHSKQALKTEYNSFLFDITPSIEDDTIIISCEGALDSFVTIGLPQGRWEFTINDTKHSFVIADGDYGNFISFMESLGVSVASLGNNRYSWSNEGLISLKMDAVFPYANGYEFYVDVDSNQTVNVVSTDDNGWVNRFIVCLVSPSSLMWNILTNELSSDYKYVNYTAEKGNYNSTAQVDIVPFIIDRFKKELDGYALSVAVEQLLGAVDWVLDPANNQIKYKVPSASTDPNDPANNYYYMIGGQKFSSFGGACSYWLARAYPDLGSDRTKNTGSVCQVLLSSWTNIPIQKYANPAYDPNAESKDEEKTLPLDVVAQKVISNAESSSDQKVKAGAQAATMAAAQEVIETITESDLKSQLEANKTPK